jgi:hypothetical protein
MSLTLRGIKGSALTIAELDNNFIYLNGRDIAGVGLIGCDLTISRNDGTNFSVNLSGCTGGGGGTSSGDTYVTTGYTSNNILYLVRNDAVVIEIPLNIELSGATVIYNNVTATPTTIGGIPAGSTFTNQTMQQMWDALLYPYQYPAFSSFSRTNILSEYELGQQVSLGAQTFSWANSNDSNVTLGSLVIEQLSPSVTTLASGLNPDVPGPSSTGLTITIPISSATQSTLSLYKITGTNTQAGTFNSTISRTWKPRWYYGKFSGTTVSATELANLPTNALVTNVVNTYYTIPSGLTAEYIYFAVPNTLAQPSDFYNSTGGCFGTNHPFVNQGSVVVTNSYNIIITYTVYRITNPTDGDLTVWLCT